MINNTVINVITFSSILHFSIFLSISSLFFVFSGNLQIYPALARKDTCSTSIFSIYLNLWQFPRDTSSRLCFPHPRVQTEWNGTIPGQPTFPETEAGSRVVNVDATLFARARLVCRECCSFLDVWRSWHSRTRLDRKTWPRRLENELLKVITTSRPRAAKAL